MPTRSRSRVSGRSKVRRATHKSVKSRRVNKRSRSRRGGRCARLRGGSEVKKAIVGAAAGVIGIPILAKYAYDRRNGGSKPFSDPDNKADDKQLIISTFGSISNFGPILDFYRIYLNYSYSIQLSNIQVPPQQLQPLYDEIIATKSSLLSTNIGYREAFLKIGSRDELLKLLLSFYIHSCYFVAYNVLKNCSRLAAHESVACSWMVENVDEFEQLIISNVTKRSLTKKTIETSTLQIVLRNIEAFFNNNETNRPMVDLQTKCIQNKTTSHQ